MPTSEGLLDTMGQALRRLALASTTRLFVACTPVPPDRKVSRSGHIYWGKTYAETAAILQREFALILPDLAPHGDRVCAAVESVFRRPKTSKLDLPKPDVDNLAKSPMDAVTKVARLWRDDTQVQHLFTSKRWAEQDEEPGVRLYVNTMT